MSEAGWSSRDLVRALAAVSSESGRTLRYDRSSASHWLRGTLPRPLARALVNEAFSRRLGRRVEIYSQESAAGVLDPSGADADPVARLVTLADDRVGALNAAPYQTMPLRFAPEAAGPGRPSSDAAGRAVTADGEVMTVASIGAVFAAGLDGFGGGLAIDALAGYLAHDIAPRLKGPVRTSALRERLYGLAAELTGLCALMHVDQEEHATAQHYASAAIDLAAEYRDLNCRAVLIRDLSAQAHALEHHEIALRLADDALRCAASGLRPMVRASLHGQRAVAAAACGAHAEARGHLALAGQYLTDDGEPPTLLGSYHPSTLRQQEAEVLAAGGEHAAAVHAAARAVRLSPQAHTRPRALALALLVRLHLHLGQQAEAVAAWHGFLAHHTRLRSLRVTTIMRRIRAQLKAHLCHHGTTAPAR